MFLNLSQLDLVSHCQSLSVSSHYLSFCCCLSACHCLSCQYFSIDQPHTKLKKKKYSIFQTRERSVNRPSIFFSCFSHHLNDWTSEPSDLKSCVIILNWWFDNRRFLRICKGFIFLANLTLLMVNISFWRFDRRMTAETREESCDIWCYRL